MACHPDPSAGDVERLDADQRVLLSVIATA
jgi:hypothetical protein